MSVKSISTVEGYRRDIKYWRGQYDRHSKTDDFTYELKEKIMNGLLDALFGLGSLTEVLKRDGKYDGKAIIEIDRAKDECHLNLDKVEATQAKD